jgi:hypothetical protein
MIAPEAYPGPSRVRRVLPGNPRDRMEAAAIAQPLAAHGEVYQIRSIAIRVIRQPDRTPSAKPVSAHP